MNEAAAASVQRVQPSSPSAAATADERAIKGTRTPQPPSPASEGEAARLFPSFIDTPIPLAVTPLSQLISLPSYQHPSYRVEAAAVDCSFAHERIGDLVHVTCRSCLATESLEDRVGPSIDAYLRAADRNGEPTAIPCLYGCLDSTGDRLPLHLVFNLFFSIRDRDSPEVVVSLSTFSAVKLFGVSPKAALTDRCKREKVFKILQAICPANHLDRHDNFLTWLLRPIPVDEGYVRFNILTVTSGCSASIGSKSPPQKKRRR